MKLSFKICNKSLICLGACAVIASAHAADYYSDGKTAYEQNDYLRAAENFYAALTMPGFNITQPQRTVIHDALTYSREEIRSAIEFKKQFGNRTIVEIVSEGKADGFLETQKVRISPSQISRPRPSVPPRHAN